MNKNEENSKPNNKENNPFSLPDGYFGSFSQKMMHKIELVEELKEFKLLSAIDKKLPFVTPDNYFAHIEIKNELAAYPKLASVKTKNGFVVPEFYFETSAKAIISKIELAEELHGDNFDRKEADGTITAEAIAIIEEDSILISKKTTVVYRERP